MEKILEICVDSLASARAAIAGGADRLELCSALALGGLSPAPELFQQIRQESSIPIRCLMRTRGGDFLYTQEEIQLMCMQIHTLKSLGADGFVIGCLTSEGILDETSTGALIEAADGASLTLHRCIDVSRDPLQTYQAAGKLGIDTVLTSGAARNCVQGKGVIQTLLSVRKSEGGPSILVGAGVNAEVIRSFRKELPELTQFHMSGKTEIESGMVFRRDGVPMGIPGMDEWHISLTSETAVGLARKALDE